MKDLFVTWPQYVLPQHFLSKMMSALTHSENKFLKSIMIQSVIDHYGVNMDEAAENDLQKYPSFNHFFTRALKPGMRPMTSDVAAVACPADGAVSQVGVITNGDIFQAKGKSFSVVDLLGGNQDRAESFRNGKFATIYLSPKDYHRLHMPLTGTLLEMIHIPGRLFSVNAATTRSVPGLFARNERVVAIFSTEAGPMAMILVGAIFVSSIETVWHGVVTPPTKVTIQEWQYQDNPPVLPKGEEMGRFNMGSTVILLFGEGKVNWNLDLVADKTVKLGEMIGTISDA